ncbi:hypothetical protein [Desulfurivibrio dismutans]|uniref:hypothetical protein n=1 Tax=Desulfurivibrio dismutans TaxID=1398908 RepID=UPI0023D9A873|nr:hypothetical protein [Desulfurivibrio alkaliphilus]MDF1614013.1 hypothetical protein [Desulfurivibrio alkaliphilus]
MGTGSGENTGQAVGRPVSDEAVLKVAKEIVVKFIEVGRLSPTNFSETFREIHGTVRDTVRS